MPDPGLVKALRVLPWLLLLPWSDLRGADVWDTLAPLPTPRQEIGVAALGGKVYVIGGILANRSATGAVERFDVASGVWEAVNPLPDDTRVHHVGAAVVDGMLYSVGGLDSSFGGVSDVFSFNPATGAWARAASLPRARGAMGVADLGGRIFAAGGQDGATSFPYLAAYDPEVDGWEILPDMPTARNHLAAAVAGGRFHAISGRAGGLKDAMEAYDPVTRAWRQLEPIITARAGISAAAVGGMIFVFGGEGNAAEPRGIFHEVEAYDLIADAWESRTDMAKPRHGIGAATVDGRIYIPGGATVEGFGVTDVHDVFIPDLAVAPGDFVRGNANLDGAVDISDVVFVLVRLFLHAGGFPCEDAADAADTGGITSTDAIFILEYLFRHGPPPPAPGPVVPGPDPTPDLLGCG